MAVSLVLVNHQGGASVPQINILRIDPDRSASARGVACSAVMRIGFIINPIAGMGGRVGLKGTDGVVTAALELGAAPVAAGKAAQMLCRLQELIAQEERCLMIQWLTSSGQMGEMALRSAGFKNIAVVHHAKACPQANDTIAGTRAFLDAGVELIIFCGGDGTARDIAAVTKKDIPILGIPSGVKMYSGVFGVTAPQSAEIVLGFLSGNVPLATVDVVDLDEARYRKGEWVVRLYHSVKTPFEPSRTQLAKALVVETGDAAAKVEIAEELQALISADADTVFLLGPGSTVQAVAEALGIRKTLLGIDAVLGDNLVGSDLNEAGLLSLCERHPKLRLVVSPIGAQGFLLGRGNLQISPDVIRRIGSASLLVVATPAKLARTPCLRFDTGELELDAEFTGTGYVSVIIGRRRRRLVPVAH